MILKIEKKEVKQAFPRLTNRIRISEGSYKLSKLGGGGR
jgi:hypothetical protein